MKAGLRARAISILLVAAFAAAGCSSADVGRGRSQEPPPAVPRAGASPRADAEQARASPEAGNASGPVPQAYHPRTMVVTAHRLATEAAIRTLRDGGTAVDAAIAAQMVLNVVEPQSAGIGGGGFMVVFDAATRRVRVYDGRETAPSAMEEQAFLAGDGRPMAFFEAVDSGLSAGVPGLLRMLEMAHARHGRRPWASLVRPAIALAEGGFAVSPRLARSIAAARARLAVRGATAATFLDSRGQPPRPGAWMRNRALARSLREIADRGPDALYQGPLAGEIVTALAAAGPHAGRMTRADLAAYRAIERAPVCAPYRQLRVCGVPPPSSGGVGVLQWLGLVERRVAPGSLAGDGAETDIRAAHLFVEAGKLAYADRARYLRDPAFGPVPVAGLVDPQYLGERALLLSPDRVLREVRPGRPPGTRTAPGDDATQPLESTTHLSIVDADGNAVSLTSSIEQAFGSAIVAGGFLLNNQLTDFSFRSRDPRGRPIANRVEPGKRPRSTMAPTLVFARDGRLLMVLGSPGGSGIIAYVARVLVAMVERGEDLASALAAPNLVAREARALYVESGAAHDELASALARIGHGVRRIELASGLNAIVADCGRPHAILDAAACDGRASGWHGAADPRREGFAAGTDVPARRPPDAR